MRTAERQRLDNVFFAPPQPKEQMPRVWSLCDAALVHLRNDPVFQTVIPSKIFEAMAMGLPIILVAPDGEARRIIEQTGAGLHVPPETPMALRAALEQLAGSDELRQSFAKASRLAASAFTRERQAFDMLEVLERVFRSSRDGAPVPELA
jgi:glycosyltransferase involved in cell wall biosynthesis